MRLAQLKQEATAAQLEGVALPAGQLLPEGFFGVSDKLEVVTYDPEGAKAMLAEAGAAPVIQPIAADESDALLAALDRAALRAAKRAGRFAAAPSGLTKDQYVFSVSLTFARD